MFAQIGATDAINVNINVLGKAALTPYLVSFHVIELLSCQLQR